MSDQCESISMHAHTNTVCSFVSHIDIINHIVVQLFGRIE